MSETKVRIFVSSPGDTNTERALAKSVVGRLAHKYREQLRIEAILWEDEPLVATEHFQGQIARPADTDIVVIIVWWRLGTLLPPQEYRGDLSGDAVTGTQWEFENAFAAYQKHGKPDLLFYRKEGAPELAWGKTSEETLAQAEQVAEQQRHLSQFVEKWLADARVKKAHWVFTSSSAFEEMLHTHLDAMLQKRVDRGSGLVRRWLDGSPFRGLHTFGLEHAGVFFGRARARNEVRDILDAQVSLGHGFVLVLGASGSGKSSLVQAGLLADLKIPGMIGRTAICRHGILQPSGASAGLLRHLAGTILGDDGLPALADKGYDAESLEVLLRQVARAGLDDDSAGAESWRPLIPPLETALQDLCAAHQPPLAPNANARLVIVVDQLEELFTQTRFSDDERAEFAEAIHALVRTKRVWVVATLRSDFYEHLVDIPRLARMAQKFGQYLLEPPTEFELGQIIREPAIEAGVTFERHPETGVPLDEAILQAARGYPDALPLLEFTLDELWQLGDRVLTYDDYESIGGFEGAISVKAEEVLRSLDPDVQDEFPRVLRSLATSSDGALTFTSRIAHIPDDPRAVRLVDQLAGARLLVAESTRESGRVVRLAHEALLREWSRARRSLEKDALAIRLRGYLESRESVWREAPVEQKKMRLLAGLDLLDAQAHCREFAGELSERLLAFVAASAREQRRRRWRIGGIAAMVALLVGASALYALLDDWSKRSLQVSLGTAIFGATEPAMAEIPAGSFVMGSSMDCPRRNQCDDERPMHRVTIAGPFFIARYEVTNDQYDEYLVARDESRQIGSSVQGSHPASNVTRQDALDYIRWLNETTGKDYRLPSEAEWEYAALGRAIGSDAEKGRYPYWWGENLGEGLANCGDCDTRPDGQKVAGVGSTTVPVGSFAPNPFGLYDVHGNVTEHVADCYHDTYDGAPADGTAWEEEGCVSYVFRGGGFDANGEYIRTTFRARQPADLERPSAGFRLASSRDPAL